MSKTRLTIKHTNQFKKDYKLTVKRGLNVELLEKIIAMLAMGQKLPEKHRDHFFTGKWMGHRECHIRPD